MKPLQQDDIQDWLNEPRKAFRFIHLPTKNIVRAETKSIAITKLKSTYNINAMRKDVRQTRFDE